MLQAKYVVPGTCKFGAVPKWGAMHLDSSQQSVSGGSGAIGSPWQPLAAGRLALQIYRGQLRFDHRLVRPRSKVTRVKVFQRKQEQIFHIQKHNKKLCAPGWVPSARLFCRAQLTGNFRECDAAESFQQVFHNSPSSSA